MSASFAKTPGCNRGKPIFIRLTPGRLELGYKVWLSSLVALPAVGIFWQLALRPLRGDLAAYTVLVQVGAFGAVLSLLALVMVRLWRPFNGAWVSEYLRYNAQGWWLGSAGDWSPLTLHGEQLICPWLVRLRVKCALSGVRTTLWLWSDGDNLDPHRRLRVLLYQGGL